MANLEEDMGYLFSFYDSPDLYWEYLRTTNPIERVFLEIKKRRCGCGAFANRQSSERIVFGVFLWLNRLWEGKSIWQERARRQKAKQQRTVELLVA